MEFFMSARRLQGGEFTDKIGAMRLIAVDEAAPITKDTIISNSGSWFKQVQRAAGNETETEVDILFFVHGFNTEQHEMRRRYKKVVAGLREQGFRGPVVGFDWPSDGTVLGYASDRRDARAAAEMLMEKGIKGFVRRQLPNCQTNLHILAHSMGCFVVREAFDYADDSHTEASKSWSVAQVALVAADISSNSMTQGNSHSSSLLRHSARLTNYYSPYDAVLSVSNIKRVGVSRRLGRVGLPENRSDKTVNLNCGPRFQANRADYEAGMAATHAWYFDSAQFYKDLSFTLAGELDREVIPTRRSDKAGLVLI
ncbi:MAG: hypothetical protein COB16_01930 [Rhodobacteraceae bacterium]|nr:MAG: hypothetical protein COB16_01930 [Paracoccaceae bacterium]